MSGECDESVILCIIGLDRILSDVAYENQRKGGKQIRYFYLKSIHSLRNWQKNQADIHFCYQ